MSRFAHRGLGMAVLLAGQLLQASSAAAQCAMCREAAGAAALPTQVALNYAIVGLALAPYLVVALGALSLSPGLRNRVSLAVRRIAGRVARSEA